MSWIKLLNNISSLETSQPLIVIEFIIRYLNVDYTNFKLKENFSVLSSSISQLETKDFFNLNVLSFFIF